MQKSLINFERLERDEAVQAKDWSGLQTYPNGHQSKQLKAPVLLLHHRLTFWLDWLYFSYELAVTRGEESTE
jgi:hypothetical protein